MEFNIDAEIFRYGFRRISIRELQLQFIYAAIAGQTDWDNNCFPFSADNEFFIFIGIRSIPIICWCHGYIFFAHALVINRQENAVFFLLSR